MHGTGKAVLEFGNCSPDGKVVTYKNFHEIKSVFYQSDAKVVFDFQDGDDLTIKEDNETLTSAIKFKSLDFLSCSSEAGIILFTSVSVVLSLHLIQAKKM